MFSVVFCFNGVFEVVSSVLLCFRFWFFKVMSFFSDVFSFQDCFKLSRFLMFLRVCKGVPECFRVVLLFCFLVFLGLFLVLSVFIFFLFFCVCQCFFKEIVCLSTCC